MRRLVVSLAVNWTAPLPAGRDFVDTAPAFQPATPSW